MVQGVQFQAYCDRSHQLRAKTTQGRCKRVLIPSAENVHMDIRCWYCWCNYCYCCYCYNCILLLKLSLILLFFVASVAPVFVSGVDVASSAVAVAFCCRKLFMWFPLILTMMLLVLVLMLLLSLLILMLLLLRRCCCCCWYWCSFCFCCFCCCYLSCCCCLATAFIVFGFTTLAFVLCIAVLLL